MATVSRQLPDNPHVDVPKREARTLLKERINANTVAGLLQEAIHKDDRETVVRLLRVNPNLLHIPLWSGNWGPPMSHAANLGRLEIIKAAARLGARDHQHAFDRAL